MNKNCKQSSFAPGPRKSNENNEGQVDDTAKMVLGVRL